MAESCVGVVSVQRVATGNAVDRHIVWGALVDREVVITPGPGEWTREPDAEFEVLVASARRHGTGFVERIRVQRANLVTVASTGAPTLVNLRLERPSLHRPELGEFDSEALSAALAADPDIWRAMVSTGMVPKDLLCHDVRAVLGPVSEWEQHRRRDLVRERVLDPAGDSTISCCFLIMCWRCQPCQGRWW